MSELRQRMIDQMTLRGFSPRTHESYLGAVIGLARHYHLSPDQLNAEQVRQYLLYLEREKHLAWSSLTVAASGLRFLYFRAARTADLEDGLLRLGVSVARRLSMDTKHQMLKAIEELPDDANVEDARRGSTAHR